MANTTWKQVVYDVADGIRTLLGTSSTIPVGELKGKLTGITRKSAATYTPSTSAQTIAAGQYLAGTQTIAAMPSGALSDVSVSSSGLITAQVGTSGYLASGTKKTKQLTTKGATTITPSTSAQTAVASGVYTTGTVTVSAVPTETKSVIPTSSSQTVTPSSGKFFSSVTVEAGGGIGDITNGTIAEYVSKSGTIAPGTLVQCIEPMADSTSTIASLYYPEQRLIKINDTKAIVAYIGRNSSGYELAKANIISIADNVCTLHNESAISINGSTYANHSIKNIDIKMITEDKFVMYSYYAANAYPYLTIGTISGNLINFGTPLNLGIYTITGCTSILPISETKILLISCTSGVSMYSNTYKYRFFTINGTTITAANTLTDMYAPIEYVNGRYYYGSHAGAFDLIKISDTQIAMATFKYASLDENENSNDDGGIIISYYTISGNTLSFNSSIYQHCSCTAGVAGEGISRLRINEDLSVVASYYYGSSIYCTVGKITGFGTAVFSPQVLLLDTMYNSYDGAEALDGCVVKDREYYVSHFHKDTSPASSYGWSIDIYKVDTDFSTISKTNIATDIFAISGSTSVSSYFNTNQMVYLDGALIIVPSNGHSSYKMNVNCKAIGSSSASVKLAESRIDGITKTSCTESTAGQIWILG